MPATDRIARRLGGPGTRRRRHRRFALAAAGVLAVAVALIVVGGGSSHDFEDDAGAICADYVVRIQDEFELSFPEGAPDAAAFAEYTSHAFADTMDDLLADLRALDPPAAVADALDRYEAALTEIRERPEDFVDQQPFADAAATLDEAGVPGCGSEFFAALAGSQ